MPIAKSQQIYFIQSAGIFHCLDDVDDLVVNGNYNTQQGNIIIAKLEACTGRDDCKTAEEARQYLTGTNLAILKNNIKFEQSLYGAESIVKQSKIEWVTFTTKIKQVAMFEIQTTQLSL